MSADQAKFEEINAYFKERMAESKKIWSTRGKEARMATVAKRPADSWRSMRGVQLMVHEMGHVGNKPFAWGFATIAVGAVYMQLKFSEEARNGSDYWTTFHKKH